MQGEIASPVSSPKKSLNIDLNALRTIDEIKDAFDLLKDEEDRVEQELEEILSTQGQLETQLRVLAQSATPQLSSVEHDAQKLATVIGHTASLADGVSAKVKQLDLAKSRVSDCQQRVNDLIDLRLCSDGVKSALAEEDYEQAAAHLHRFLAMDEGLLKLTASELHEGDEHGAASLEIALQTLHEAEHRVRFVVSQRFDEAVKHEDLASIERFFKIFPLINMHEGGLQKFTTYLCSKLVDACKKNLTEAVETAPTNQRASVIFADTLTLLFEGIARTVEIHQPLIETYYGPGRLTSVLFMLQEECDKQADRILAEFRRKRALKEIVSRVREMLYGSSSSGVMSSSLTGSLPPDNTSSSMATSSTLSAKDLDHVLGEMALLQARSEMYFKFVRKRSIADIEIATSDEAAKADKQADMEMKLMTCGLCRSMQELLSEYILLEDYFMSQNIRKATEQHREMLTSSTLDSTDLTMTAGDDKLLDDVFYIVKQCVSRAVGSGSVDGLCAVANNACSILEADFASLLQSQLKMGFPSGYLDLTMNVIQTSLQQGYKMAAAQATGDSERQKIVFLTALNNAENATDYISRLTASLRKDVAALVAHRSQHEKDKVDNCLSGFSAVASKLKAVLEQGMQQLRQSVVKPRIKPWVDTFVSHDIDEETFADFEANDPFIQTLIMNLDNLLGSFKRSLTPANYDVLVSILAAEVTLQLEKVVFKSKFSRLGGLLFDREVRSLVSFLTSGTTWTVRDKFARLTQIATVLNLESVSEISDIWGQQPTGGSSWKLSPAEVKLVMVLRMDFKGEEIKKLRL